MTRRSVAIIAAAVTAAAFAVTGPPSWSQEAPASTATQAAAPTAKRRVPRSTATPEMIAEAIERSKARTRRLQSQGVPEQFGSEEPYVFSPSK